MPSNRERRSGGYFEKAKESGEQKYEKSHSLKRELRVEVESFSCGISFSSSPDRLTVLLIVPFYSFHPRYETRRAGCPIGLELIASELIAKGFNTIFIDACMGAYDQLTPQLDGFVRYGLKDEELENVLTKFNPKIVGITSMFSNQWKNVDRVAEITRKMFPSAIIVEGGSHATGDCEEVMKSTSVDMVVRREGLTSFPNLCSSIEEGTTKKTSTQVQGVTFKDISGKIVHNPDQQFLKNFDTLAPRRLEITLHPMYETSEHTGGSRRVNKGRHSYILSSEGCPLRCDFCHIPLVGGNIRYYSLNRFEKEVAALAEAGVTEVVIEDDMFFADIPRALEIGKILKKYSMVWFEEGGLSMFKFMRPGDGLTYQKILDDLAKSGMYRYYAAIESANVSSLEGSHKPGMNADAALAEEIIRYGADVGIEAVGGFMLGFKGKRGGREFEESLDDIERTVAYAARLKNAGLAYVMLFLYTAIPGTPVYKYIASKFPNLDIRSSHERAAFPVSGVRPDVLTELRLKWMEEVNGISSMDIAKKTKNWGL